MAPCLATPALAGWADIHIGLPLERLQKGIKFGWIHKLTQSGPEFWRKAMGRIPLVEVRGHSDQYCAAAKT